MILAFGDLHVNKEPIRITECLNFLEYIKNYCMKNNIKTIVNLGDTFHQSNSIRNQAFIPIFMKFMEISKLGISIITIVGNHDAENNDNDALVETFSSFGKVIKKSETLNIDGTNYDFLSYTEDPNDLPNKSQLLFTHLAVQGFYFNPYKIDDKSIFTQDLFSSYSKVVSGHIHKHQEKNGLIFVGSPYQTRKDEINKISYFALIDNLNIQLIEYKDAPEYMEINAEDFNNYSDFKNKIVTVKINKKIEGFTKLRDIIYKKGGIDVIPEFIKEEQIDVGEHSLNINEGVIVSATKYLKEKKVDGIDNNKLMKCFKNILKRCKE
jgi:DNA repair exonuclease SbcCD nuclease subunit